MRARAQSNRDRPITVEPIAIPVLDTHNFLGPVIALRTDDTCGQLYIISVMICH